MTPLLLSLLTSLALAGVKDPFPKPSITPEPPFDPSHQIKLEHRICMVDQDCELISWERCGCTYQGAAGKRFASIYTKAPLEQGCSEYCGMPVTQMIGVFCDRAGDQKKGFCRGKCEFTTSHQPAKCGD